jgi:hypothetical protein
MASSQDRKIGRDLRRNGVTATGVETNIDRVKSGTVGTAMADEPMPPPLITQRSVADFEMRTNHHRFEKRFRRDEWLKADVG